MIKTRAQKSHFCKAVIFSCLDWRLHPQLENYFKKKYGSFDLCATAGSIKGFLEKPGQSYFLKQIEISQKLHHSQTIIITLHHDCGAFGGFSSFENAKEELAHHKRRLNEAGRIILNKFPNYKIEKYFLNLKFRKNQWRLLPKKIK